MGLLGKDHRQTDRAGRTRSASRISSTNHLPRICRFEQMEPRRLLSIDVTPIQVGAVYFEDAIGADAAGDLLEVTFNGGAPGTQLTGLIINTDKRNDGELSDGDPFFDTDPAAPGASASVGLSIDDQTTGIDVASIETSLADGGTSLVMTFTDFDPGDRLVFSIDVDEGGFPDPNPVVEGKEFEGSRLTASFAADHFFDATGTDIFFDDYDGKLGDSRLDLPPDAYKEPLAHPRPDQTAAAIFPLEQIPLPITITGTVFEDVDLDNLQDPGDPGLAGVDLALFELIDNSYVPTGRTAVTDADGDYRFEGVSPGTYRIAESQPQGYFSVGATAGTVGGVTRGIAVDPDRISDIALLGGEDSVDNDFAEALPVELSGNVYHDADDDGLLDPGETGIGGASVEVQYLPPEGQLLPPSVITQTDADGAWSVANLMPGTYRVTEDQPAGYFDGLDAAGTAGGVAHNPGDLIDAVHLLSGQTGQEYNFGELLPASISGRVIADFNGNCTYDAGDVLLSGVTIYLLDSAGNRTEETLTDENGEYQFSGLHPGIYAVEEVQPPGYYDGNDHVGSAGGALLAPDSIVGITLVSAAAGVGYDFCELPPSSIAGRIHAETNGNCTLDPGEIPLADVTVHLLDASGIVIETTQSNAAGNYRFTNLPPGSYGVWEIQPEGYFDGPDHVGTSGGSLLPSDSIVDIELPAATDATRYDFCELPPVSIAGRVYADANDNGIYQAGETLLAGVTVHLLGAAAEILDSTQTDAGGAYSFTALAPGVYSVREVQPAGYFDGREHVGTAGGSLQWPDSIVDVTLPPGTNALEYDFGELPPGSIAGRVYVDLNDNGAFEAGEALLAGVTVHLLGTAAEILDTTQTDAGGEYSFDGLAPGVYGVREIQPAGYHDGREHVGTAGGSLVAPDSIVDVTLPADTDALQYDFGELLPASIAGRVFVDANLNRRYDKSDTLLAGVTVHLLAESGRIVETTQTDSGGAYSFTGLAPGVYGVEEIQPAGYFDGPELVGSAGGSLLPTDSIIDVALPPGTDAVGYDFCETPPASISGYVYADDDNDGVLDAGENGIGGVEIELLDFGRIPTGRTTVTNAEGFYRFGGLASETYGVAEVQPGGYFDGLDTAGSVGGAAHNPGDSITDVLLKPGINATSYNFGELRPASISGRVHAELNGNCWPDPGEPLLAGVTIYLLDATGDRIQTTLTDENGEYSFDNLRPDTYGVEEIQPDGYLQWRTHPGSAGGRLIGEDVIVDAQLGSGVDAVDYNFCEMVPARISGYVFQDGPTIEVPQGETAPDPATVRDGQFTPDDKPIEGVVLKLGDGSGAPILDANGRPISTVTEANGYYEFTMLPQGLYTVLEVHPENYVDSIDTAGTNGGLAINPSDHIDPMMLFQLAVNPRDDAIIRIPVNMGDSAESYNFSEVLIDEVTLTIFIPPPISVLPPPQAIPFTTEPVPAVLFSTPLPPLERPDIGFSSSPGYTWHLSVINAGRPRRDQSGIRTVSLQHSPYFDPATWTDADLGQSQWIIAGRDAKPVKKWLFGLPGGIPVTGDFNGDGIDDVGVYIDGNWFLDLNGNGVWDEEDFWAKLGSPKELPVVGDWDGDGKSDIGVFGPAWPGDHRAVAVEPGLPDAANLATGRIKNVPPEPGEATLRRRTMKRTAHSEMRSDLIDHVFRYGNQDDLPIAGDFNGDGVATIGVFRNGTWFLDTDGNGRWNTGDETVEFGEESDVPVVGDFNNDGIDELGVYRSGTWHLDSNANRRLDAHDQVFHLGGPHDRPVVGDFNGDGTDEIAIYQDQVPPPTAAAE